MPAGIVVWWDLVPWEQWGWLFPDVPVPQELLQLEDRLGSVSRGAVQNTIERFTFPHKYKKVSDPKTQLPAPSQPAKGCGHGAGRRKDLGGSQSSGLAPPTKPRPEAGEGM